MTQPVPDIIDQLAGIAPGSPAETLRDRRPVTKAGAQASWIALFAPADDSQISLTERFAVAVFIALLHGDANIADFYAAKLRESDNGEALPEAVAAAAAAGTAIGPYGHYPAGPLSAEDRDGPVLTLDETAKASLGARLAAALEHSHLLVFRPRDAKPEALGKLLDAGWSTTGIVTLSQLVAFLAFQIRVVAGLKALSAA